MQSLPALLLWYTFNYHFRIKIELHFSLIAAAVTYIMWKHVGDDRINSMDGTGDSAKKLKDDSTKMNTKKRMAASAAYWRVDCQSASKGLFLGLLCLVGGIIILIIFFVMKVQYYNRPHITDTSI